MKLDGRRALVTGAGQGIGRAIALRLAEEGADVAVVDINSETAAHVGAEIVALGRKSFPHALDVSDSVKVLAFVKELVGDIGGIDILVNNAGVTRDGLVLRLKPEDWDFVMDVNLKGAFNCIRAVARSMISTKWGRIVNITSVIGQAGNAGQSNYAASKAGLIALTKSVAKELAGAGVTVNAVAPGFIETPMTQALSEKVREDLASKILLKRLGEPRDVANVVAFLVSDEADYVTGQTINVDGGMVW